MGIFLELMSVEGCNYIREKQEIREIDLLSTKKRAKIYQTFEYIQASEINAIKELYNYSRYNIELLTKFIKKINKQFLIKAKIDELSLRQSSKIVEIGTANICNNLSI